MYSPASKEFYESLKTANADQLVALFRKLRRTDIMPIGDAIYILAGEPEILKP